MKTACLHIFSILNFISMKFSEILLYLGHMLTLCFLLCYCSLYHICSSAFGILLALAFYKGINGFMIKAGMVSDLPRIFQIYTFHLTARSDIFSNVRLLISRSLWFLGVCFAISVSAQTSCLHLLPETCIHSSKQKTLFFPCLREEVAAFIRLRINYS